MREGQPDSLVFKLRIPAAASDVYRAWTVPDLMRVWLAPGANVVIDARSDVRIGGDFLIRSRAPDGALHTITGVYRELEPARRIAMTWNYAGPIALLCEMETLIEIELHEDDPGSTAMTFTHSRIATQAAADGYEGDWPSCFDKLNLLFGMPTA